MLERIAKFTGLGLMAVLLAGIGNIVHANITLEQTSEWASAACTVGGILTGTFTFMNWDLFRK